MLIAAVDFAKDWNHSTQDETESIEEPRIALNGVSQMYHWVPGFSVGYVFCDPCHRVDSGVFGNRRYAFATSFIRLKVSFGGARVYEGGIAGRDTPS